MLLRSGAVAPQEPQEAEAGGVGKPGAAPVQALLPRALWASASPRPLLGLSLHPQMRASDGIGVTSYGSKLACLYPALWLRMVLTHLNGWKEGEGEGEEEGSGGGKGRGRRRRRRRRRRSDDFTTYGNYTKFTFQGPQIKFYWHKATTTHLPVVHGDFHSTRAEPSGCNSDRVATEPKLCTPWPFPETVCRAWASSMLPTLPSFMVHSKVLAGPRCVLISQFSFGQLKANIATDSVLAIGIKSLQSRF